MTPSRLLSFEAHSSHALTPQQSQWLLGPSPAVAQLWLQIRRVAPHFRTALLLGEPGSGAEQAARALHQLSPEAGLPFVMLSAGEAETRFRTRAQQPLEGVLFLAELERLSHTAQTGLLQFLRRRIGYRPRVLAASTRSLRTLVAAIGFNAELAAMLGVIHIALPALRERTPDIATLANTAVQMNAQARNLTAPCLSPCLLDAARAFLWPGNLDQLQSAFRWLIEVHGDQPTLYARDLESALAAVSQTASAQSRDAADSSPAPRLMRLDLVVQHHVCGVLNACHGNKLRAAEVLGISRSTLYRMLDQNISASHSADEFAIAV
jgi:two-component system response regulator HydG